MSKNKHNVIIDTDLCIGCGLCAKDCVAGYIYVENGKARTGNVGCISCGHCEAVCPQGAVRLTGFEDESEEFDEQTRLDASELMRAIKTRRSIRQFRHKEIPDGIVQDIIEAGRLAPTASNSQNTEFIVLGSKQALLEKMAVKMFRTAVDIAKPIVPFLKQQKINSRFFFKGAPLVIVLTGNRINASLAAENMAFMAEAHGLGVLFSGFFTVCVNSSRKIRRIMKMSRGEKAVTTLVIGYPNVKYHRTARREKAKVRRL